MATAKVTTKTIKTVTLELNEKQATVIKALTGAVSGSPIEGSYREASSEVFTALSRAGILNRDDDGWSTLVKFDTNTHVRLLN